MAAPRSPPGTDQPRAPRTLASQGGQRSSTVNAVNARDSAMEACMMGASSAALGVIESASWGESAMRTRSACGCKRLGLGKRPAWAL